LSVFLSITYKTTEQISPKFFSEDLRHKMLGGATFWTTHPWRRRR